MQADLHPREDGSTASASWTATSMSLAEARPQVCSILGWFFVMRRGRCKRRPGLTGACRGVVELCKSGYVLLSHSCAGLVNDLHMFSPSLNSWLTLSNGSGPSPRQSHGFASCGNKLYVFGGWDGIGIRSCASVHMYG